MIRIRACALIEKGDKILLIKHQKDSKQYYLLPGGGVENGETIRSAVEREVKEELGIDCRAGKTAFISESISPNLDRHIVSVVIHCDMISSVFLMSGEERIAGYDFLTLEQIMGVQFYPDFKDTLNEYLTKGKVNELLVTTKWKD